MTHGMNTRLLMGVRLISKNVFGLVFDKRVFMLYNKYRGITNTWNDNED